MCSLYYKVYIGLLFLVSNCLLADGLKLPSASTCSLNVAKEQQGRMLTRCLNVANAGDKEAQYQLGLYYLDNSLTPDYSKAIIWLKKASMQAHLDAQIKLGYIYFKGLGTPVDKLQAYIIFKVAGINGSDEAMDIADEVASQMTTQELQQSNIILGKNFRNYLRKTTKKP